MARRRLYVAVGLALTAFTAVIAATPGSLAAQDTARVARLCYRGRPKPSCDRFVLTELGFYRRVASTVIVREFERFDGGVGRTSRPAVGNHLAWEVGLMANRGRKSAVGGTLLLGVGEEGGRIGVKGRYRRWLTADNIAADYSAGLIVAQVDRGSPYLGSGRAGVTADASLNAADYGAVTARVDVIPTSGRTAAALYGGVRLGSRPALVGTGLLAAGFVVLIAAFSGWE